jgi:precorrin-6B methylase 2
MVATLFFGYAPPLSNAFTDIVDLGGVTGAVSIDWSLGVKHKVNLTGNVTITQTNYAAFEGQKVQEIQITSSTQVTQLLG